MTSKRRHTLASVAIMFATPVLAQAQAPASTPVPVTADNFIRAESDTYAANLAKEGGLGKLLHRREPAPIQSQSVIRLNRDTLYTSGVFDLDAGPVTITLPDAGQRFMSLQSISEDHYATTSYGAGPHTLTRDVVGTRYVIVGIRTLVDPTNPEDVKKVHALQDAMTVSQTSPGQLALPYWDPASQKKVRDALLVLATTLPDTKRMFGTKEQVDPIRHLIGSASAWGGNNEKDALYLNVVPGKNDDATVYKLTVRDVPVDGFWSVSLYNAEGYYQANPLNAYSVNNITADKAADGSVVVQFGGCDGKISNCLPTMSGWNYMVRLYRPRGEILSGGWQFPEAQPVN
jgi:hypothetical protein